MKNKGIGGHTKPNGGRSNDWLTPPSIIQSLGRFDLDPCACIGQPWPTARVMYTTADDGLSQQWFGRVWMNPPYGRNTGVWLQKLAMHGNGIALVFARTETKMFVENVWGHADAMLFLHGRLYFHYPDGTRGDTNAGGPSVLIAYGQNNVEALRTCGLSGSLVTEQR